MNGTIPASRVSWTAGALSSQVIHALNAGALILLGSREHQNGRGRSILCGIAALMSDATVTFMAVHGRGLVSITVNTETAFRLGLRRMSRAGQCAAAKSRFLISIEASACRGTGISASDRAATLRAAGAPQASQDDLVTPGHVMPYLVAETLSARSGLPEAAHAMVASCSAYEGAAWCDVLGESGDLASLDESVCLARHGGLDFVVADDIGPMSIAAMECTPPWREIAPTSTGSQLMHPSISAMSVRSVDHQGGPVPPDGVACC